MISGDKLRVKVEKAKDIEKKDNKSYFLFQKISSGTKKRWKKYLYFTKKGKMNK